MIIELSDTRRITSDDYQFMYCKLIKRKDKKTGEIVDYWKPELYYNTVTQLLRAIPTRMLRESDANGWAECKEVLDSTYAMIDRRTKGA